MRCHCWHSDSALCDGRLQPIEHLEARAVDRITQVVVEAQLDDTARAQNVDGFVGRLG